MTKNFRKGFTALEIIIALGIISLLGALSLVSFLNSRRVGELVTAGNEMLAVLRLAHEKAVAGQGGDPWGVRLAGNAYYLFQGVSYGSAVSSVTYIVPSSIEIANIALAGGGQEILFRSVDGITDQQGTFTVRVRGAPPPGF